MCIKLLIIIDYVNKCKIKQNFFNVSNNFYNHFLFSHDFRLFCLFSLQFQLNNMTVLEVLIFLMRISYQFTLPPSVIMLTIIPIAIATTKIALIKVLTHD